ncbi:hypothetical protein MBLNU230_g4342t1 [Neophaeotheca triangularis]
MPHSTESTWPGPDSGGGGGDYGDMGDDSAAVGFALAADGGLNDLKLGDTERADDAVDYEDISDDDLPEEEEATAQESGDGNGEADTGGDGLFGDDQHMDNCQAEDAFQNGDYSGEINDLFGDPVPMAVDEDQNETTAAAPPPARPIGIALPTKGGVLAPPSGYAPVFQAPRPSAQDSPKSISSPVLAPDADTPTSAADEDEDDVDDADLTPAQLEHRKQVRAQRDLFAFHKRHAVSADEPLPSVEEDLTQFWSMFPEYEPEQNPRFVDLFPVRRGQYNGRHPLKPPKTLLATKPRLELAPDQERLFITSNKADLECSEPPSGVVFTGVDKNTDEDEDAESDVSFGEDDRLVGGLTLQDFSMICADWEMPDFDSLSAKDAPLDQEDEFVSTDRQPSKRRKIATDPISWLPGHDPYAALDHPERALRNVAKQVTLDLNDHQLLIDEHAPPTKPNVKKVPGSSLRDAAARRDLAKRYNISNDEAYDLLKENHQHKVRSTLGSVAVEHSMPATRLQWPFYQLALDAKATRAFHRPTLDLNAPVGREYRVTKPKMIKRKHIRGRDTKDVFANAEDLTIGGDNATALLLEYSEEVPTMLSNLGMGSRLINYYRKRDADDNERPKRELGETQVLLNQDKSPFSNFGHVDAGDTVPTIQNGLYRAPIFQHTAKPTDFLVTTTHTYASGRKFYIRNVENLHAVGQQFPLQMVPTEHSRRVTDAAKRRLRAMAFRIWGKVQDPRRRGVVLDNETLLKHIPGGETTQLRGKMREFMQFVRAPGGRESGTWAPKDGHPVPDNETIRSWISPEEICLFDSMQMGVRHLRDLGLSLGKDAEKDAENDKDLDEDANIELKLAPWYTTKHFINACQGKAMLKLHGEGDPTGQGLGFSFIKTSMKGGFQALGESAADKILAKKRKEGGHHYNVAEQQRKYDEDIRTIWQKQRDTLSSTVDLADAEDDDDDDIPENTFAQSRAPTPRTSFATPSVVGRHDDDSKSQFSKHSSDRVNDSKVLVITRKVRNRFGQFETEKIRVDNPKVIKLYNKRSAEKQREKLSEGEVNLVPTGDAVRDEMHRQALQAELARLNKNQDRRLARERAKQRASGNFPSASGAGSPAAAGSPAPSDIEGPAAVNTPANGTPTNKKKSKGGDGTTKRKCANCGIEGHIKTNKKYVFNRRFRVYYCLACDTFHPQTGMSKWEQAIQDNGGSRPPVPGEARKTSRKAGRAKCTADQDGGAIGVSSPATTKNKKKTAIEDLHGLSSAMFASPTLKLLCPLLNGTMKPEDAGKNGDSSFGAVPAPLTL